MSLPDLPLSLVGYYVGQISITLGWALDLQKIGRAIEMNSKELW